MAQEYTGPEKRKAIRITVNYVVTYQNPGSKDYDITQVRNISQRGLLLISSRKFSVGDLLKMKIKLPFLPQQVEIIGEVVDSHKLLNTYETRVKFGYLEPEVFEHIGKLVKNAPGARSQKYSGPERRAYPRAEVRYVIHYRRKGSESYDITQVTSISQGGLLFLSTKGFNQGDLLNLEIKLPYAPHRLEAVGSVVATRKVADMYETRVKFVYMGPDTFKVIGRLVEREGR